MGRTGYFLLDNANRRAQYNLTRRAAPWGRGPIPQCVVHTYEAPHTRSLMAAATYLVTRKTPGSYHWLGGDDSASDVMPLAPVTAETWHCIPSNPWAVSVSGVAYAHAWNSIPARARTNLAKSMAHAAYRMSLELIAAGKAPIPPRWITRAEAMRGVWGFVMHADMDPGRRSDAGRHFPRDLFITEYRRLMGDRLTDTPEDDVTTKAQMDEINRWIENIHRDIKETLPGLVADAVANFTTSSEKFSFFSLARFGYHAAQATNNALPAIAAKVGAPVDTDQLAAALAESLTEALAGSVSGEVVEGAVRRVFADAANPQED